MKHKLSELITDPSTGEWSLSRLSLAALIIDTLVLSIAELLGHKFNNWSSLALIIGSVAGVYGFNSGLRVWHGKLIPKEKQGE